MSDNIISNRKAVRQRMDSTALHKTKELSATTTFDVLRLDIVAKKVTIQLAAGLTADIDGSVDGSTFFVIAAGATGAVTYGDTVGDHLVKWIKITRTAGDGQAVVVGA